MEFTTEQEQETDRLAGAGCDADLVLAAESEDARLLRDLAQKLEAHERGEARAIVLAFRAWLGRVHHREEELELVRDRLERACAGVGEQSNTG